MNITLDIVLDSKLQRWTLALAPEIKFKIRSSVYYLKRFAMKYYLGKKRLKLWANREQLAEKFNLAEILRNAR